MPLDNELSKSNEIPVGQILAAMYGLSNSLHSDIGAEVLLLIFVWSCSTKKLERRWLGS